MGVNDCLDVSVLRHCTPRKHEKKSKLRKIVRRKYNLRRILKRTSTKLKNSLDFCKSKTWSRKAQGAIAIEFQTV